MSPRAALRLESLGHEKVFDYTAGLADWKANGLPTEGRLAQILKVNDAIRADPPTCRLTDSVGDAARQVKASGHNQCVVTSDDGIVLGRLRLAGLKSDPQGSVEAAMEEGPTTIRPDMPLDEYAAHMRERRVGSVLVTGSTGRLFGVLYRDDAEAKLEERRRARDQSTSA